MKKKAALVSTTHPFDSMFADFDFAAGGGLNFDSICQIIHIIVINKSTIMSFGPVKSEPDQ